MLARRVPRLIVAASAATRCVHSSRCTQNYLPTRAPTGGAKAKLAQRVRTRVREREYQPEPAHEPAHDAATAASFARHERQQTRQQEDYGRQMDELSGDPLRHESMPTMTALTMPDAPADGLDALDNLYVHVPKHLRDVLDPKALRPSEMRKVRESAVLVYEDLMGANSGERDEALSETQELLLLVGTQAITPQPASEGHL